MGAWGPAIFSDDDAADVRDEYRRLLGDGVPDDEAAARAALERHLDPDDDEGTNHVVWLALAATQSQVGRLDPTVRDRALTILDEGLDHATWAEAPAADRRRRATAREKLRARLTGPQPPRRPIRREWRYVCDLSPGDVLRVPRESGGHALLLAVEDEHDPEGEPSYEWLAWGRDDLPDDETVAVLPVVLDHEDDGVQAEWPRPVRLFVTKMAARDPDWRDVGIEVVARLPPRRPSTDGGPMTSWHALGHVLDQLAQHTAPPAAP